MQTVLKMESRAIWSADRFFDLLQTFSRMRVILKTGPSVFEALCAPGAYSIQGHFLNVITPEYHWHLDVSRFGFLQSFDEIHARSGRRVLFFSLSEKKGDDRPFLQIYLYRGPGEEFDPQIESGFMRAHEELQSGVWLSRGENVS